MVIARRKSQPRGRAAAGETRPPREVRRESEQLTALVAAQRMLASDPRAPGDVLEPLVERAQALVRGAGAAIEVPEGAALVCLAACGVLASAHEQQRAAATSLAGECLRTGVALSVPSAAADPRIDDATRARVGAGALVLVPLFVRRHPAGVLAVASDQARSFDRQDVELLQVMGEFLAVAIANAREAESVHQKLAHERNAARAVVRQTEARLEANLRLLIESSPDMIVVQRGERVLYANRALFAGLGYDPAQGLLGRDALELFAADERATVRPWMAAAAPLAGPSLATRLAHRDGHAVAVEALATLMAFDGEPAVVLVCRDVTRGRAMEQQLAEAERMASIGQLAAGLSHEINNPLSYTAANLDMVLEALTEPGSALAAPGATDVPQLLREAREGTRRVQQIVRDLRTFASGDEDARSAVDVRNVLESAVNVAWNEIRHRARLVKHYGEVPAVEANEGRLGQVFLNLLVHAAQALPTGQADRHEIHVSTERTADGRVQIEVRDTGHGIAPELLDRVFEPFATLTPARVGTGLGLSICKRIVTSLGGEIRVSSQVGFGASFRVILPPARVTGAPAESTRRPITGAGHRGRILVVDDDPLIGKMLSRLLSREHDVVVAESGHAALAHFAAGDRFDLVLSDLMMPEMTGLDFYAELLRRDADQAARVTFLTGGAFSPRERAFLAQMPGRYLEKPLDIPALRALVARRLG